MGKLATSLQAKVDAKATVEGRRLRSLFASYCEAYRKEFGELPDLKNAVEFFEDKAKGQKTLFAFLLKHTAQMTSGEAKMLAGLIKEDIEIAKATTEVKEPVAPAKEDKKVEKKSDGKK